MLTISVIFITVLCCVMSIINCAVLGDVELIPEEMRAPGAQSLGRSLSLHINQEKHAIKDESSANADQAASGSDIVSPTFDFGYGYGDLKQRGDRYFQQQNSGNGQGEVGFYGSAGKKGVSGHVAEDAYVKDQQEGHGRRADEGYYGTAAGQNSGYDVGKAYYGNQALNRREQIAAVIGSRGGYRKGHHSSGFHNSYHKDESGNNSSFYDEAIDAGGRFLYDGRDGSVIDQAGNVFKGVLHDSAFLANGNRNQGQYGVGNKYDNENGHTGNYGRGEYYNNAHGYGHEQDNEKFKKNIYLQQTQDGDNIYAKADAGHTLAQRPTQIPEHIEFKVPIVYQKYYPVQREDYYHDPAYDYYSGPGSRVSDSDHYETLLQPDVKPVGHYIKQHEPLQKPENYFGMYRGVAY